LQEILVPRPLDELLAEAREIPAGPQREAWIAAACGANLLLERDLRELIAADRSADAFLANPLVDTPPEEKS
jgi:hypothetical protein